MNAKILFVFLLLSGCAAVAQSTQPTPNPNPPPSPGAIVDPDLGNVEWLRYPHWAYSIWADYGNGVGTRTDVRAVGVGVRLGRVLTREHGSGCARGTLEYDIDLTPAEIYHLPTYTPRGSSVALPAKNYYTAGFDPFVAKWNFTSGRKWAPYVAAEGGIVFSNGDLPQGDTSNVNFTSGAAFGLNRFDAGGNAWMVQGKVYHLSNASLGLHNPGINAAVQFKIGYTWFK
ncbi:MAG TPA: acyloxyacyl hydrolase [Candidatus Koribacter sp.]|jgi:hypothetical protein